MVAVREDITDWAPYNARIIDRDVDNVPSGDSLAKAYLTVKRNPEMTDLEALFQCTITPVSSPDGLITDTGAGDNTGHVRFTVSGAKAAFRYIDYWYDLKVVSVAGEAETLLWGRIVPAMSVTAAST